jgi:hypothetical protein
MMRSGTILEEIWLRTSTTTHDRYFLLLTYPNIKSCIPVLNEISRNIHALELRVDLLESQSENFIKEQISLLRQYSPLPIIFTVRSIDQGKFSGSETDMIRYYFFLMYMPIPLHVSISPAHVHVLHVPISSARDHFPHVISQHIPIPPHVPISPHVPIPPCAHKTHPFPPFPS